MEEPDIAPSNAGIKKAVFAFGRMPSGGLCPFPDTLGCDFLATLGDRIVLCPTLLIPVDVPFAGSHRGQRGVRSLRPDLNR